MFTRCRPYRKDDQAWVERKNGPAVRRLVGYRRFEGLEATALPGQSLRRRAAVREPLPAVVQAGGEAPRGRARASAIMPPRRHAPAPPCPRAAMPPRRHASACSTIRERMATPANASAPYMPGSIRSGCCAISGSRRSGWSRSPTRRFPPGPRRTPLPSSTRSCRPADRMEQRRRPPHRRRQAQGAARPPSARSVGQFDGAVGTLVQGGTLAHRTRTAREVAGRAAGSPSLQDA